MTRNRPIVDTFQQTLVFSPPRHERALSTSSSGDEFVNYEVEYVDSDDVRSQLKRKTSFGRMICFKRFVHILIVSINVLAVGALVMSLLYFVGPLGPHVSRNVVEFAVIPNTQIPSTKVLDWQGKWINHIYSGLHLEHAGNMTENSTSSMNNDSTLVTISVLNEAPTIDLNSTMMQFCNKQELTNLLTRKSTFEFWDFVVNPYSTVGLTVYYQTVSDASNDEGKLSIGIIVSESRYLEWKSRQNDVSLLDHRIDLQPDVVYKLQYQFQPHFPYLAIPSNFSLSLNYNWCSTYGIPRGKPNMMIREYIDLEEQQVVYIVVFYTHKWGQISHAYTKFDSTITNYSPVSHPLSKCTVTSETGCTFSKKIMDRKPYFLISATSKSSNLQIIQVKYRFILDLRVILPLSLAPLGFSLMLTFFTYLTCMVLKCRKHSASHNQASTTLHTKNKLFLNEESSLLSQGAVNSYTDNNNGNSCDQSEKEKAVFYHRALFYGSDYESEDISCH